MKMDSFIFQLQHRLEGPQGGQAVSPIGDGGGNWNGLRKQLREFTLNTQQELELERAELLTQNAMLEQEVKELNDYIDNHLTR